MNAAEKPTWILETTPDFTDGELLTKHVAHAERIGNFGFRFEDWPVLEGPVVAFGTIRCMSSILRQPGLANSVFDDYALLQCTAYYGYLYPYLKRLAVVVPMAALREMDLQRMFGAEVFIRPNSNKKPFEAEVVSCDAVAAYLAGHQGFVTDLVVLSEVIEIQREFRCFCRNGQVFAHSSYLEDTYGPVPDEVQALAAEIAGLTLEKSGMNMVTVDLAATPEGLALIEIGGVNSWGFYGADIEAFVAGMEAEALARHADLWA